MRLSPHSFGFTLLLSLLAALPPFGIDMSLPALTAIGTALVATPAQAGLTMSLFMLGFAGAPLAYGPISDRYGRKPVVLFACTLFVIAGIGCALATSLPALLAWRLAQGAGAGASLTIAFAIIRDVFDGAAARAKISYVTLVVMLAPMMAPTLGAFLLSVGGWRAIYLFLIAAGAIVLVAMTLGFEESRHPRGDSRLSVQRIVRDYGHVLRHRLCLGYILVNAVGFGALFAYISGSSLYLIDIAGLTPAQYGLVFAATSAGIMLGSFLNGRFSTHGVDPERPLAAGLVLAMVTSFVLVMLALFAWMPLWLVVPLFVLGCLAFGLISPNAAHGALQPLPELAGVAAAVIGCMQMVVGALSSALVAELHDGRTAFSMTAMMAICSLGALTIYMAVVRPAERRVSRLSGQRS